MIPLHAQQSACRISSRGAPVLTIDAGGNAPKIAKSVVESVAIDVVYDADRWGAVSRLPCEAMRVMQLSINSYHHVLPSLDAPSATAIRPCEMPCFAAIGQVDT